MVMLFARDDSSNASSDGGQGAGGGEKSPLQVELRSTLKLPPRTIHSSTRPFDQFIQGFKTFPRARPAALFRFLSSSFSSPEPVASLPPPLRRFFPLPLLLPAAFASAPVSSSLPQPPRQLTVHSRYPGVT